MLQDFIFVIVYYFNIRGIYTNTNVHICTFTFVIVIQVYLTENGSIRYVNVCKYVVFIANLILYNK